MLYHHSDGYPSFQLGKIVRFLEKTIEILDKIERSYWWDGERVSALFVALSAASYETPGFPDPKALEIDASKWEKMSWDERDAIGSLCPVYQPCTRLHGDIEYLYRVRLSANEEGRTWSVDVCTMDSMTDEQGEDVPEVLGVLKQGDGVDEFVASLDEEHSQ